MRRAPKSNTGSLLTALVVIAGIACFYFVGWPAIQALESTNRDLAVARADLAAGEQYITDIKAANSQIKALEGQLSILNIAAPAEPDIPEALVQINAIVNKNSLTLETVAPSAASDGSFKIGLTINGEYAQLKQCLIDFEKNLRPIQIDELSITMSESEESGTATAGSYNITMSYVKPQTAAEGVAGPATGEGGVAKEGNPTEGGPSGQ